VAVVNSTPPATAVTARADGVGRDRNSPGDPGAHPVCPECESAAFDDGAVHHELVCQGCGLVVNTHYIDHGPEWRAHGESTARTGLPMTALRHDRGLTTTIDWRDADAAGNPLSPSGRRRAARLRRWHGRIRVRDSRERTLRRALGELDRAASALELPGPTREVAATICRRAVDEGLARSWSTESIATASLYAGCRRANTPRSLDQVTDVARVDRRDVGRAYKHVASELGLELPPPHPGQYVGRLCSDLDLPASVRRVARAVLERVSEDGLVSGKSPTGYAAASVFAASLLTDTDCSARRVARTADVTRTTVWNRTREQLKAVGSPAVADGLVGHGDPPADWRDRVSVDTGGRG
jgi:transcription initiation factor TFIIB